MILLKDELWFESHQALLLRIVNTGHGRDLLCIDKDFPIIRHIGKNFITGISKIEDGRIFYKTEFRVGAKYGNVVRSRWSAFQQYAKKFYDNGDRTNIWLDNKWRLASTTSTFYPDPHPETTSVDGRVAHNQAEQDWSVIRDGAGTAFNDNAVSLATIQIASDGGTDKFLQMIRGIFLFDTSSIGADSVSSATFSFYGSNKADGLSATPDINVYSSNPASNTGLVAGDYDSLGTTDFATAITYASFTTAGYNDFILNASGISAIDTGGVTKLGLRNSNYDVADVAPTWSADGNSFMTGIYAETAGTTQDPKLVVEHSTGGVGSLVNGGLINNGLTGGRLT